MIFRSFIVLLVFLQVISLTGQEFLIINSNRELLRVDIENCTRQFVSMVQVVGGGSLSDITYTEDGRLWGITTDGRLFLITESTGETALAYTLPNANGPFFTSLVADGEGRIYTAGVNGDLYAFDINTMAHTYLGNIGYGSAGDLTFYDGQLIMASTANQMINVNLDDPGSSSVRLNFNAGGQIFGIVTFVEDCDNTVTYATNDLGSGGVFQVDFENDQLTQVCALNTRIYGAASSLEFLAANPIEIDTIYTTPTTCASPQGAIEVAADGGNGPLSYSLDSLTYQAGVAFTGLLPGDYTVYIQDGEGCTASQLVAVEAIGDRPALAGLSIREDSCGAGVGAIEVETSGGLPPYTYTLNGAAPAGSPPFIGLPGGAYDIRVADSQGCSDSEAVFIPGGAPPQIARVGVTPCGPQQNSLFIDAGGGSGTLVYALSEGAPQPSPEFSGLEADSYLISVIDEAGCSDNQSVTIPAVEALEFTSVETNACGPERSRLMVAATGGTGAFTYRLNNGPPRNSGSFENLSAGEYTVLLADEAGCTAAYSGVIPESAPIEIIDAEATPSRCGFTNGALRLEVAGGTAPFFYILDGREQMSAEFTGLAPGHFLATVLDANGCSATDSVMVGQQCPVYFPNAFSPNDDGRNDRFEIYSGAVVQVIVFRIFNRWGGLVYEQSDFESSDNSRYWDGQFKEEPAPAGVYAFYMEWVNATGELEFREGEVLLVR